MKHLKSLMAAALLTSVAGSASAFTFTYSYPESAPIAGLGYYSSTLNFGSELNSFLTDNGLAGMYTITSAVLEFGFADDDYDSYPYLEEVRAWAGTKENDTMRQLQIESSDGPLPQDENAVTEGPTASEVEVDGSHYDAPNNYDYREAVLADTEYDEIEAGELDFKVKATEGDAWLKTVRLKVEVEKSTTPHSVPDAGATLGLFSFALLGLAAIRRKFAK